jgi:hypothetical protein
LGDAGGDVSVPRVRAPLAGHIKIHDQVSPTSGGQSRFPQSQLKYVVVSAVDQDDLGIGAPQRARRMRAVPPGDRDGCMRSVAAARNLAGQELTSGWTD